MLRFFTSLRGASRRSNLIHKSSIINHKSFELGSRGMSSVYIIIFIIILTFAIMLSGGGGSLFTGNIASPDIPTPTRDPAATPPVSPTPSSASNWSISHTFKGCGNIGLPGVTIIAYGSEKGYITVEAENSSGGYDNYVNSEFIPPGRQYGVVLLNSAGFNTKKWRVRLFSGGSLQNSKWQGGTEKASDPGIPTGCI